jgi:hypothetical protein
MQQLGPDAVLSLLQACSSRGRCSCGDYFICHPAVGSFNTAALEQLLLPASQQSRLSDVCVLLAAPAAAGLSAEAVAILLRDAEEVLNRTSDPWRRERDIIQVWSLKVLHSLLALAAAQHSSCHDARL